MFAATHITDVERRKNRQTNGCLRSTRRRNGCPAAYIQQGNTEIIDPSSNGRASGFGSENTGSKPAGSTRKMIRGVAQYGQSSRLGSEMSEVQTLLPRPNIRVGSCW